MEECDKIIIFDLTGKTESVLNKAESINTSNGVLIDVSDATNIYDKINKSDQFSLEAESKKKGSYNVKCKNNNDFVYVKYSDKCYAKLPSIFKTGLSGYIEANNDIYTIHNVDDVVELHYPMYQVSFNKKNNQLQYSDPKITYENENIKSFKTHKSDYNRFIASRPGWLKMVKAGFEQHPFKESIPKLFGCDFSIPACIYGKGCCSDEVLDERYGEITFTDMQKNFKFSLNDLNKNNLKKT